MDKITRVVSGPLALKMQRVLAARENALGIDVTTLPLLAARLAGGFQRPASAGVLQPAIRAALDAGGFVELERVRILPGMVRAAQRTLTAAWRADLTFDAGLNPRLADLAKLDQRVRAALPAGCLVSPDLRDGALGRIVHARPLLGSVELIGLLDIDPVWRPLLAALARQVPLTWQTTSTTDRSWFLGKILDVPSRPPRVTGAVICADPHAEIVEALRWARALMTSGVRATDIAISAVSCGPWDAAMQVLAKDAGLPIHFTHGVEALQGSPGQACASLADLLLRGLSQARVRRLFARSHHARDGVPPDWWVGLEPSAGLFTEAQWRRALGSARNRRADGQLAEEILLPRLAALSGGPSVAAEVGPHFLDAPAMALWHQALRAAPPEALEFSLQALRVADGVSPGSAVAWGPAAHLAAAPRPYVRLLGLSSRAWPRAETDDPLLPDHILPRVQWEPIPRPTMDVVTFEAIRSSASEELVLSRSRKSAEGSHLAPSRLFPTERGETLSKVRTPAHAFSLADRLLARPLEARETPALALAHAAWQGWRSPRLTAWDGVILPDDPVILESLSREQSATSLRRLLRDPLGFVWRHALGMAPAEIHVEVLSLDARDFGILVHAVIEASVTRLELGPGLNRATPDELEAAVSAAGAELETRWPAERPVPPPLLWKRTVDEAMRLARAGLTYDQGLQPGTRSWSEVAFGAQTPTTLPWSADNEVVLGNLKVKGFIDRLDLRGDGAAARVTDYKTGSAPRRASADALAAGGELQRVIYAKAVRCRIPEVRYVVSRLVYLGDGPIAHTLSGDDLDNAIATADRLVEAAAKRLRRGAAPPGPDAQERFNDMRLALPASLDLYMVQKAAAFRAVAIPRAAPGDLA